METRELASADASAVIDLWERCGLTRPWNPPGLDFDRAVGGPTSAVLGSFDGEDLVAAVMVGDDGHRGWIYYLAVDPARQGQQLGRQMMTAAEHWMLARGVRKVELMVRRGNHGAAAFYDALGYNAEEVAVFSQWLSDVPS